MSTGLPLAGRRIVVTRARAQASSLVAVLVALGAEVIEIPAIEIVPPKSYGPLDTALRNVSQYRWLVVTSANTARVLASRTALLCVDFGSLSELRVVAVGAATASALREIGLKVEFVPEEYVAESLVAAIGGYVAGQRVLLARAAEARDVIPEELRRLGATVDAVDAYRNVIPAESVARIQAEFGGGGRLPDAITFTSSSTVRHFFSLLRTAGLVGVPTGVKALSIGPVTSETLREFGWEPAVEAVPHDVEGLVEASKGYFAR